MIDYDALGEIRDWSYGWRAALAPGKESELSSVYVEGEGDNPHVMIIGEAPGATEEIKKRPFVGDSGLVLRELMSFAGLFTGFTPYFGEANCWLTNVIKFRPPKNRTPLPNEIKTARHGLRREWEAIGKPRVIVPVGAVALKAVKGYGQPWSILRLAGKPMKHKSRESLSMFIWPMVHPSYGIRNKSLIPLIEKDWERFGQWIKDMGRMI